MKMALHPSSAARALWDMISMCFVMYDLIYIPLQLLEPDENTFTIAMLWTTKVWWTVDMLASFGTGFVKSDGLVEMRAEKIAWRYIRTWFPFDLLLVCFEWFDLARPGGEEDATGFARLGKASRTFRIIRMVRLLR